jgi:hypothetical protein
VNRWPLLALASVFAVAAACSGSPQAGVPVTATAGPDAAIQAQLAMAAGNWHAAAEHLRVALRGAPKNLDLHYRLAVCASHVGAREEAVREFEWVIAHGAHASHEARVAQAWLSETQAVAAARASAALTPVSLDVPRGNSTLGGAVTWLDSRGAPQPQARRPLMLVGLDSTPTKGLRYRVRTSRDGRYEFRDVVAGSYTLVDAGAGAPMWRLRVVLEAARDMVLDLSADNSAGVRDDAPQTAARPATTADASAARSAGVRIDGAAAGSGPSPHTTEGN